MKLGRFKRLKVDLAARFAAGLVAFSVLLGSGAAPAAEVPVFLGSIGVGKAKPELESELRSLLRAELAAVDFSRVRTSEHYMLSATLVRLESVQSADSARATCVVSVAVLRDRSTLHALINGRATAEEANPSAARRDALRAAVHSAMVRVPKALR
ncbi:MAG TPA: hypothetical protein VER96_00455 [Polyangiaceae bacterium]|nr:hypothetical protein [Polyangiaceae bacterium]